MLGIPSIISGIVSGVVGPIFGWLGKREDVKLDSFRTATGVDLEAYKAALDAHARANEARLAQQSAPGAWLITFAAGTFSVAYFGSIVLDSMFHLGWNIAKLPPPWDSYVWIILQSFVVISPTVPLISATSAWLRKR